MIGLGARVGEVLGRGVWVLASLLEGAALEGAALEGAALEGAAVLGAGWAAAVVTGDDEAALAVLTGTGGLALVDGLLACWACGTHPASGSSAVAMTVHSARRGADAGRAACCGTGLRLAIAI